MAVSQFPVPVSVITKDGPLKFVISVGITGNNGFVLSEPIQTGTYSIASALNDQSYDVYFLGKDGQQVGYTNTLQIVSNAEIHSISVIGGNQNDILTFERVQVVPPSTLGLNTGAGAYVTSVNISALQDVNDSVIVIGGNFAANVLVHFIGGDLVERQAKSVVRNSATQLVAVRPDVFPVSSSPFSVRITNPGTTPPTKTNSHILTNAITAGGLPTWITASGALSQGYTANTPYSFQLVANDADGGSGGVSYTISSGTLMAGLSLSTSGLVSGTVTTSGLSSSFTVTALDDGQNTASRVFQINEETIFSGGTVITSGGFRYHIFKTSANLTQSGGPKSVEILTVGGGGGGVGQAAIGGVGTGGGGGGGAANSINSTTLSSGTHTVTVGAGGAGVGGSSYTPGIAGSTSTFLAASGYSASNLGGNGANGTGAGAARAPSGGAGGNGSSGVGGSGANGGSVYFTWATVSTSGQLSGGFGYYGGGAAGGSGYSSGRGTGGLGGGGLGGAASGQTPTAGGINTGGGGGGGTWAENYYVGANGGSGIVVVRYLV